MSIYITQQQKEEWEAKIAELVKFFVKGDGSMSQQELAPYSLEFKYLKELLDKSTVLPVEESWEVVGDKSLQALIDDEVKEGEGIFQVHYPNGVIIKQS